MSGGSRQVRAARVLALVPLAAVAVTALAPAAAADTTRAKAGGGAKVQLRVTDISPSVAPSSATPVSLAVRLTLTNTSDSPLSGVGVTAARGEPIGTQEELDKSLAAAASPMAPSGAPRIPAATPVRVDLPARSSVSTVFTTEISKQDDGSGICQCANSLYPIVLAAASAGGTVLGSTTAYVPAQVEPAEKTKVSWVWPLVDRPHRLTDDAVFLDDALASSVSGGRLDRALQVVENLSPAIPMSLVIDPELVDELQVMAAGRYKVATSDGTVAGTGQAAAAAWLARLAALANTHPATKVSLTPYADPDVRALTAEHLAWSSALPTAMQRRVTTALQGRAIDSDVAWPAGGVADDDTLDALHAAGASTVVLDGSSLRPSTSSGTPVAVARLRAAGTTVTGATTSPAIQRLVASAVSAEPTATTGSTALPYLLAETTIRAIQAPEDGSDVVLTPPRYVDPDPARAVRAIQDTSNNGYATPVDVRKLRADRPAKTSTVRAAAVKAARRLPTANLDAIGLTQGATSAIGTMLARDADARNVPTGLTQAAQRVASSAWLSGAGAPFAASTGPAFAGRLAKAVVDILDGVHIVRPTAGSGNYTLGSRDSSLPITVQNELPYSADIDLTVSAQDMLPGYEKRTVTQRIAARSKQTVQVPSQLARSGRIAVEAKLTAPTGRQLGRSLELNVRSTNFGTVGIVITVVAGAVLVVALFVRFGRRLLRLNRAKSRRSDPPHPVVPTGKVST